MKLILIIILIFTGCNEDPVSPPPEDFSIVGTWQAVHLWNFDDSECQVLEDEEEGPFFVIDIDEDICNGEEECGGVCSVENHTGSAILEFYMHYNDFGTSYEWGNFTLIDAVYSYEVDYECDEVLDECNYSLINEIDYEIDVGVYELDSNSIIIEEIEALEYETGTIYDCNGCSEEQACNTYEQVNCFNDGNYDQDNTQEDELKVIDLLTEDRLIIREIDLEWNECDILEFIRIDGYEMGGCMDADSFNYNPAATFDDGSCGDSQCPPEY